MNAEERQQSVDKFQNDPRVDCFVGSIEAAGVGITLTRSSRVLFAETSWTPGKLEQASDRAHRIGQKDSVNISHLVFNDSLDATMLNMVVDKMMNAKEALDSSVGKIDPAVVPDFTDNDSDNIPAAAIPVAETRYQKRLREAANCPDGVYVLENPVEGMDTWGTAFEIKRSTYNGKNYLFVSRVTNIETRKTERIEDQDIQDKLLPAIVADPKAKTRWQDWKAELAELTQDVPAGYYAIDGTGTDETDFFSIARSENRPATVSRYLGGTGAVSTPLPQQIEAAKQIAIDSRAAAERFACELGTCFCCARPLTNDASRSEGIGPDCREQHAWFKDTPAPVAVEVATAVVEPSFRKKSPGRSM